MAEAIASPAALTQACASDSPRRGASRPPASPGRGPPSGDARLLRAGPGRLSRGVEGRRPPGRARSGGSAPRGRRGAREVPAGPGEVARVRVGDDRQVRRSPPRRGARERATGTPCARPSMITVGWASLPVEGTTSASIEPRKAGHVLDLSEQPDPVARGRGPRSAARAPSVYDASWKAPPTSSSAPARRVSVRRQLVDELGDALLGDQPSQHAERRLGRTRGEGCRRCALLK